MENNLQEAIPIEFNNPKQIKENLRAFLALEYLGVHIEEIKESDFKQLYYFSVPERSTLKVESEESQAETADDLIQIAKETLIAIILNSCKAEVRDEEFYKDVKDNISDYVAFFAKIRKGEVWNEEMGQAAMKKISDEFKNNAYKQV